MDRESVVSMIKIGDVLFLEPRHSTNVEKYKCRILEKKDNTVYIDYPMNMETNRTVFLIDGTQLKGTFISGDGSVYLFECEVLRRVKGDIPMIILSYPGAEHLVKIQRRQFVRIETGVDVAVRPIDGEFAPFVTVTDDISAGGAAIINDKKRTLSPNMMIQSWFVLPMQNGDIHYLKLKSKIVRIVAVNEWKSLISLQFIDISQSDRQVLLRFCFDRQLAYKKKGIEM
ncbi:flagellar brake domain-containing protein [Bacillus sp. DTU_2020_1000418_1_SI_GHA_SEK_038]|uniref:flagellar brake protein n=1 Tax=Bacillus sp. DTU_2020_1000418_1_SI_GHA_SEK_038 TaxID=3077585 RepID=UPI0028EDD80C|nr:flagellar brake domain-containing protein [Bacillus sp. DTU_2020_1000418_1_SI_GHA_SEK_038]WNS74051.1 flagellar brake domain-containing protein [Bacillus sp. DTU_2020_1000418_1_SI_GHA_SEK_038]